ncbi:MAG: uracil-DNA glycosylase [Parvibaculaceae bacterium]
MLEPSPDCPLCPRLQLFREEQRAWHPDWFNAPVPSFGDADARLLIVGLAPGLKGANRTGRPFTGDYAGDLLYRTLLKFGIAEGTYAADPADGLRLRHCLITNAVRCVPPENKPSGIETRTCNAFLKSQIAHLPSLRAILVLGRVAHEASLRALGTRASRWTFAHGARHDIGEISLFDSYHCSRYNTNTGVLTTEMFEAVIGAASAFIR